MNKFYAILGRTLALAIVGAEAFAVAKGAGASSLLQPANLATLIVEAESILLPPAPVPAA